MNKLLSSSVISLLLLFPIQGLAEAGSDQSAEPVGELNILQVITPMLLVVILIFALAWMVKKMQRGIPSLGKDIEILASTPLSSQSRLCLVRVAGKDMLIGVTSSNITHLQTFDTPVVQTPAKTPSKEFSEQFKSLLSRKE